MKLLQIVFIGTKLRDCAAIFSMYHLTEEDLAKLSQLCHDYFTAAALFGSSVSGTVWSIGHLVYAHSKLMFAAWIKKPTVNIAYSVDINSCGRLGNLYVMANQHKNV